MDGERGRDGGSQEAGGPSSSDSELRPGDGGESTPPDYEGPSASLQSFAAAALRNPQAGPAHERPSQGGPPSRERPSHSAGGESLAAFPQMRHGLGREPPSSGAGMSGPPRRSGGGGSRSEGREAYGAVTNPSGGPTPEPRDGDASSSRLRSSRILAGDDWIDELAGRFGAWMRRQPVAKHVSAVEDAASKSKAEAAALAWQLSEAQVGLAESQRQLKVVLSKSVAQRAEAEAARLALEQRSTELEAELRHTRSKSDKLARELSSAQQRAQEAEQRAGRAERGRTAADVAEAAARQLLGEAFAVAAAQRCPNCEQRPREVVFGCGHQTCCVCANALVACAVCNNAIFMRLRLA